MMLTDCMRPSKNHILTDNFSQDIQIIQGVSQLLRYVFPLLFRATNNVVFFKVII